MARQLTLDNRINIRGLYARKGLGFLYRSDILCGVSGVLNRLCLMYGPRHHKMWSSKGKK